jgi:hypothetical protein
VFNKKSWQFIIIAFELISKFYGCCQLMVGSRSRTSSGFLDVRSEFGQNKPDPPTLYFIKYVEISIYCYFILCLSLVCTVIIFTETSKIFHNLRWMKSIFFFTLVSFRLLELGHKECVDLVYMQAHCESAIYCMESAAQLSGQGPCHAHHYLQVSLLQIIEIYRNISAVVHPLHRKWRPHFTRQKSVWKRCKF